MREHGADSPDAPGRFGIAAYRVLRAVAGEMLALNDPARLLARCGDLAQELLHADACSVALLDQRAGELVPLLTAASGRSAAVAPLPAEQLSGRMLRAIREGHSLIVAHGMLIDGDVPIRLAENQSALAAMLIPLPVQDGMHGVLWVGRVHGLPFTPDDQELAETIAALLALGLRGLPLPPPAAGERDPLTGLGEPRTWRAGLDEALRAGALCALVILDLDGFAHFNDGYGPEAGDAILRDLGRILREELRADDRACRYAGDAVAVMLPDGDLDRARVVAERLRARFAAAAGERVATLPAPPDGQGAALTLSAGIAVAPADAADGDTLLNLAERALTAAREQGRDRVAAARDLPAARPSSAD